MKRILSDHPLLRVIEATIVITLLVVLVAAIKPALAEDASINWTHPTQRVDNTALPIAEIKHTLISYGLCQSGALPANPTKLPVAAPATTVTVTGLGYGTWCFAAATVDTAGNSSVNTSVVSKVIVAPPKPPVLSSTVTVVYEVLQDKWDGVRLGREVGRIPLGSACTGDPIDTQKGEVYRIADGVEVTLVREPKPGAGLATRCAWKG